MKKKYICPTTKLLKMDVGYGIMAGSGDRNSENNGPQGSVEDDSSNPPPPQGGTTAKGYNAWEAWDEF